MQSQKIYNCDPSTILRYLHEWEIPIRKERYNSKYNINAHYFDTIDTESKAYFVGLLLADGHVSKDGLIMLTMKDLDIVEKFRYVIGSNAPIKTDRYRNYAFNIRCKIMYEALISLGFTNRKSYQIDLERILSHIPKTLEHHFVRGLFDGDGSIRIYHYDYLKNPQYHFGFTGLQNVVDYVKRYCGLHTKTVKESDITYTCVSSCKETINDIYSKLYTNATIYIDRKYQTFQEII